MVKQVEYNKAINDAREILINRGEAALKDNNPQVGLALLKASVAISELNKK